MTDIRPASAAAQLVWVVLQYHVFYFRQKVKE